MLLITGRKIVGEIRAFARFPKPGNAGADAGPVVSDDVKRAITEQPHLLQRATPRADKSRAPAAGIADRRHPPLGCRRPRLAEVPEAARRIAERAPAKMSNINVAQSYHEDSCPACLRTMRAC